MVFFLLIIKTTAINLEIINGDRQPCDFGSAMYLSVIYIYIAVDCGHGIMVMVILSQFGMVYPIFSHFNSSF